MSDDPPLERAGATVQVALAAGPRIGTMTTIGIAADLGRSSVHPIGLAEATRRPGSAP
jgi:hypothetical protein